MADWSELEQLAAAATKGVWEVDPEEIISPYSGAVLSVYIRHQKKGGRIAEFFANCLVKTDEQCRANARFAAAANPSAILALIAENKRMRQQVATLQSDKNSWQSGYDKGRADGTKTRLGELKMERQISTGLQAEVEALRKDAERYRWLRERDLETIHVGGIFAGLTPENVVVSGEDLDQTIDASMNKEVSHG